MHTDINFVFAVSYTDPFIVYTLDQTYCYGIEMYYKHNFVANILSSIPKDIDKSIIDLPWYMWYNDTFYFICCIYCICMCQIVFIFVLYIRSPFISIETIPNMFTYRWFAYWYRFNINWYFINWCWRVHDVCQWQNTIWSHHNHI